MPRGILGRIAIEYPRASGDACAVAGLLRELAHIGRSLEAAGGQEPPTVEACVVRCQHVGDALGCRLENRTSSEDLAILGLALGESCCECVVVFPRHEGFLLLSGAGPSLAVPARLIVTR